VYAALRAGREIIISVTVMLFDLSREKMNILCNSDMTMSEFLFIVTTYIK